MRYNLLGHEVVRVKKPVDPLVVPVFVQWVSHNRGNKPSDLVGLLKQN